MLTGIFQKGETPRETLSTKGEQDAPLLGGRDVWDVYFLHVPGRQVSCLPPHPRLPVNRVSSSTYTFFAAYVRGRTPVLWSYLTALDRWTGGIAMKTWIPTVQCNIPLDSC